MYKVLVFGLHDKLGGIENYMKNLFMFKNCDDVKFDFVSSGKEMVYEDLFRKCGSEVFHVPNFKRNPIGYYMAVKRILSTNEYSSVYYNMMSAANILPLIAGHYLNVPKVIAHAHNNGMPSGLVRKSLNQVNSFLLKRFVTDLWANSLESAEWQFHTSEGVEIIQNAIDTINFAFNDVTRSEIRSKYGLEGKFVLGTVARFAEQKNHRFLVEVFSKLSENSDDFRLLLVGGGELEVSIKQMVNDLHLSKKVVFVGPQQETSPFYQAMDIFILPSLFDGLPLSVLEAQSAGLKCLVSDEIPDSARVSQSLTRISLSLGSSIWANMINDIRVNDGGDDKQRNRSQSSKLMFDSKVEIRNQAPYICSRLVQRNDN